MASNNGSSSTVSINACPELSRTSFGTLIATTSSNMHDNTQPPGFRLHFFCFFISRQFVRVVDGFSFGHLQLVQQPMQIAAADAQFLGGLRFRSEEHTSEL